MLWRSLNIGRVIAQRPISSMVIRPSTGVIMPGLRSQLQRTITRSASTFEGGRIKHDKYDNPSATVDVELPDPFKEKRKVRYSTILFCITMVVSFIAIVKYEDANAPAVSSTLYTLRRSEKGREILGNNIQFSSLMPWISGRLHAGRGIVDFSYKVVGDKGEGRVNFNSRIDPEIKKFVVLDWSITTPDGATTSLMDEGFLPFVPQNKEEPTSRPASSNFIR